MAALYGPVDLLVRMFTGATEVAIPITKISPPPPPCPATSQCFGDIAADLDGDHQPDPVGLYVTGETKTARAVLATGAFSDITIKEQDLPLPSPPPLEAIGVVDVDSDGRDEMVVRAGKGGNTFYPVGILKLDGTRLVLLGEDQGSEAPSFMVDGGLFHGAGFRCGPVGPDGKPRLTVTQIQHVYSPAPVDPGKWAWKTRRYRWQGASLVLERAEQGTVTVGPNAVGSQDAWLAPYYGIHCKLR